MPTASAQPATPQPAAASDHVKTSPVEARQVDRVDVSGVTWADCPQRGTTGAAGFPAGGTFSCATVEVPLNYANPDEGTYTLFVMRRHANNPDKKQASLFVNPGGPGGYASGLVQMAGAAFPPAILDAFDIVGVDPRGVNGSPVADCITDPQLKAQAQRTLTTPPRTPASQTEYRTVSRQWADQCARPGNPVARFGSTANVARDMDVVRRAVGDDKLTFLGLSYGTILGQQYANLFPDRFRAMALDGLIDAADWAGAMGNSEANLFHRVGSAAGAERALRELLDRCDQAGSARCALASSAEHPESAHRAFLGVHHRLRTKPLTVSAAEAPDGVSLPDGGLFFDEYSLTKLSMAALRSRGTKLEQLPALAAQLRSLLDHRDDAGKAGLSVEDVRQLQRLVAMVDSQDANQNRGVSADAKAMVWCSDGRFPTLNRGISQAIRSSRAYPVFGQHWGIAAVRCGRDTWRTEKVGAYAGPFYKKTAAAPLLIGNLWDPATNHDQAVQLSRLLPNAHLVSSDSWGHLASGSSECVTNVMTGYLLTGQAPKRTQCTGDYQPFAVSNVSIEQRNLSNTLPQFGP